MAVTKPDIVIVHGGWHTPASYAKLTSALEHEGFKVHIPPLPSMSGEQPPKADLYTDSDFVTDYVTKLSDAGTHSIALMHSYGGQVGTNALAGLGSKTRASEGKPGGVVELVYMAAFAMPEGTSMIGWVKAQGHGDLLPLAFEFQDDGHVLSRDLKTLATKSWSDELKHAAWREIPVTYIEPANDMTIFPDYHQKFEAFIKASGNQCNTVVIETGHCPNTTATAQVVDVLKSVAANVTG